MALLILIQVVEMISVVPFLTVLSLHIFLMCV